MNGALAFVDTSDCTVLNIAEHYMASDVEWDPTGRYVVTSVSWWSHKVRGSRAPCLLCLRASPSPQDCSSGWWGFQPFRGPQPGPSVPPRCPHGPPFHSVTRLHCR